MVKDEDGKIKDDPSQTEFQRRFRFGKRFRGRMEVDEKTIREIGKIQAQRMEQAMVTGRRWKTEEWEMLIAKHPLMTHIAKTILWWVCFPDREKSVEVFRLTEERDYADVHDNSLNLRGGSYVGIVHPLLLLSEEKKSWGQLFTDYEIVSPFSQLGSTGLRSFGRGQIQTGNSRIYETKSKGGTTGVRS
ncbi:PF13569 domain protein [Leptospira sp. Fiocruz LV3954]|nr:PF13569 domain protein [Leptospira sp. Fiocruz LV3954]